MTSSKKTPVRLLLMLAALTCAALSTLTLAGKAPFPVRQAAPDNWRSPTAYLERPDNPLPPRNRFRMRPDQFQMVTSPKALIGTGAGHILVQPDRIDMLVGSQVVWSGPYRAIQGFDGRLSFADLAALVAKSPHPDWLKSTGPGIYQLAAGKVTGSWAYQDSLGLVQQLRGS